MNSISDEPRKFMYSSRVELSNAASATVDRQYDLGDISLFKRTMPSCGGMQLDRGVSEHFIAFVDQPIHIVNSFADCKFQGAVQGKRFFFAPASMPMRCEWEVLEKNQKYDLTQIAISAERMESTAISLEIDLSKRNLKSIHDICCEDIEGLLDIFWGEAIHGKYKTKLFADTLAQEFALSILKRNEDDFQFKKKSAVTGRLDSGRLLNVVSFLHDHVGRNVSLEQVAASAQMSPFHFCRLFKRSTGFSPHQYQLQVRIEKAKRILELPISRRESLCNIALDCGFNDQPHFQRCFKKIVGVTPGIYAKQVTS